MNSLEKDQIIAPIRQRLCDMAQQNVQGAMALLNEHRAKFSRPIQEDSAQFFTSAMNRLMEIKVKLETAAILFNLCASLMPSLNRIKSELTPSQKPDEACQIIKEQMDNLLDHLNDICSIKQNVEGALTSGWNTLHASTVAHTSKENH